MDIVFRADSSQEIGSGHIMRCLTLADALKEKGWRTLFICRDFAGKIGSLVRDKGHEVVYLLQSPDGPDGYDRVPHAAWLGTTWQQDASDTAAVLQKHFGRPVDWLVVDHYALDVWWEEELRPYTKKIMVIDDLADRPHACDLLLDQNLYEDMERRYDGLVPPETVKLLGPCYALLRPEFYRERRNLRQRDGTVRQILVFFGGSDMTNETLKALKAIIMLDRPDIAVDVVVGSANPHQEEIADFCQDMPQVALHCQINNMAELMAQANLAIGAGGSTTLERCYLGLPAITLVVAMNQFATTAAVAKAGAIVNLGWHNDVNAEDIAVVVKELTRNPDSLIELGGVALNLTGERNYGTHLIIKELLRI